MANAKTVKHRWLLIDAQGKVLGRLASEIARILRGKHTVDYTPHVDTGDFVIVINVDKVRGTGDKSLNKQYCRHSGYPGEIKAFTSFSSSEPIVSATNFLNVSFR